VAGGKRIPGFAIKEILRGEVVEAEAQHQNQAEASPCAGEFELVAPDFLHGVGEIDGLRRLVDVRRDAGVERLRIEVIELLEAAERLLNRVSAERLTRNGDQFTPDDVVLRFEIARDLDRPERVNVP